jgi:hypothetical protein
MRLASSRASARESFGSIENLRCFASEADLDEPALGSVRADAAPKPRQQAIPVSDPLRLSFKAPMLRAVSFFFIFVWPRSKQRPIL